MLKNFFEYLACLLSYTSFILDSVHISTDLTVKGPITFLNVDHPRQISETWGEPLIQ